MPYSVHTGDDDFRALFDESTKLQKEPRALGLPMLPEQIGRPGQRIGRHPYAAAAGNCTSQTFEVVDIERPGSTVPGNQIATDQADDEQDDEVSRR